MLQFYNVLCCNSEESNLLEPRHPAPATTRSYDPHSHHARAFSHENIVEDTIHALTAASRWKMTEQQPT